MTDSAPPTPPLFDEPVLDNPAWFSLNGAHAHLAEGTGSVRRYRRDVSVFGAVADWSNPQVWDDIATFIGPGADLTFAGLEVAPPPSWPVPWFLPGVQLTQTERLNPRPDDEAVVLGEADVADMIELVRRTEPGPFDTGTRLLGTYLGIRRAGRLVAMAGERFHPPGWTEISAVCTDPEFRGQGLASRLVLAVAHGIQNRGERALMHAASTNVTAIEIYLRLGFEIRRTVPFGRAETPASKTVGT